MNIYIFVTIESISIMLCFFALFVMLNRNQKLQQRQLEFVIFGCVITEIGQLIELTARGSLEVMESGRGVQIIGACAFMISLVTLTGFICRITVPVWSIGTLLIIDSVVVIIHFLDEYLNLFYTEIRVVSYKGHEYMEGVIGPAGMVFWIVSVAVPLIVCVAFLGYSAILESNKFRRKEYAILTAVYSSILVVVILKESGILLPFFNSSMLLASVLFTSLVFSRWRYQGIDVVAAAAQTAIDSIAGGVITLNQYREILYFNESARNIVPEIVYCLGQPIENLNIALPNLKVGEKTQMQWNGRRYMVSLTGIYDDSSKVHGYAILFNDMTDMYELLEKIRAEQERADEASRVKTMFLANISHEIRTPMNAIMGLSDLIIEESRGRKVYDMAVTIKNAANSLLDLVNNVLDISKLESGKMELNEEKYSLGKLVNDIRDVMDIPAKQRGLSLKCNIDESLPCVLYGDAGKLKQCLINIINNGIKFTDEGYVKLEISGMRRGDSVALTFMVSDSGVGIRNADLKRIFGEFEQVDKITNKGKEGSGLGLTITSQLVDLMGGVINVESVYGKGTTFTIRLSQQIVNDTPLSEIQEIVDDIVEEPRMFASPATNCLIVDDNKINLMVAKSLLEPYKLKIDTAASGQEAIEAVKEKVYDLIMMDHMMPGMDGVEATRHIRDFYEPQNIHPYIVALTANAFGNAKEMFLTHGFEDFVSKPIEKSKLHQVLLKAIPDAKREFTDEVLVPEEYTEDELAEFFMEGVDVRYAFDLHGCNAKEYLELLELFYMEGQEKITVIEKAYEQKDWQTYSIYTHGLKSAAINIGAKNLSENAKRHEFASKDPENIDVKFIDSDVDELIKKYRAVLSEASRVIAKQKKQNASPVEKKLEGFSSEELLKKLEEILEDSESFKTKEAAEKIDEILRHELDLAIEEKLGNIRMKYKLYDDDAAEGLLHEMIESFRDQQKQ